MFGAANAIFTGLSLVGIIIKQYYSNEEVERQGNTIKLQQFENIFFQRLALLNQLIDDIETRKSSYSQNNMKFLNRIRKNFANSCLINKNLFYWFFC